TSTNAQEACKVISYCIAAALKTLIVIHRALREADHTFQEELLSYGRIINNRTKDIDTPELFEQLPALQQLPFRVLATKSSS
nr:hypothetical protein [Tanacetum cinerariifolium]